MKKNDSRENMKNAQMIREPIGFIENISDNNYIVLIFFCFSAGDV